MEINEESYEQGSKMAWRRMLQTCCRELGYDDEEASKVNWIAEREEAISELRTVCGDFGDNDWDNNLHLGDIIGKHLYRNLINKKALNEEG